MKTPQLPCPALAKKLGLAHEVWLKREDLHPLGSHKGRSIPLMIAAHAQTGNRNFVISSSGNAALAASRFISEYNKTNAAGSLALTIFVGEKINQEKLRLLKKLPSEITVIQTKNPKQAAFQKKKSGQSAWLRQSTDDTALIGYHELAQELSAIKNLAAVFIPTSSGTTAEGLHQGFQALGLNPQIHIVQTTSCHPLVPTTYNLQLTTSLADAIVDTVGRRKQQIAKVLKTSHGCGWVATNAKIVAAQKLVKKTCNLEISPNSALAVAGLTQALKSGWSPAGAVACLITGA